MITSIQRFFLLTVGLLFCLLGCARERGHVSMTDHISPAMEVHETFDAETSFEQNLSPILTTKCALAGCHVADGPHGLDFRTYESFIAGGEHGPPFIPGNAAESGIVEQIVSGNMPPKGPPLSDAEIQVFVDWINQQETPSDIVPHDDDHDVDHMDDIDDMDDDHDMDVHDDMDGEHDDDMDDDHDDMDGEHDDDDGMNGDHDDDDNGHDNDNNGHDDDDN